jgi:hypothetical protein
MSAREPNYIGTKVVRGFGLVYAVLFIAFAIHSCVVGGDTLNGRVEDGHYFLADKHLLLIEVGAAPWHLNHALALGTIGSIVLFLLAKGIEPIYRQWLSSKKPADHVPHDGPFR